MAKIDENSIAKLKALFQDNEKALGSNFSQLIDFFNDNKVTDNGDGTFTVGNTIINVNDIVQEPEVRSIILSQLKASTDLATTDDVTTAISAATANKQDKIGYTPADDSKVVHSADASNWQKQAMSLPSTLYVGTNPTGTNFATYVNANFNNAGVYYIRDNNANVEGAAHALDVTLLVEPGGAWKYAFGVSWGNCMYYRSVTPNGDSGWKLLANDSEVVHNSGNEEIAGQKTFDTAPIDKTTGNPYITKSDLPRDNSTVVKVVTQAQYDSLADKSGLYVIQG